MTSIPLPKAKQIAKEKEKIIKNIKKMLDLGYNLSEISDLTGEHYSVIRALNSINKDSLKLSLVKTNRLNERFEEIFKLIKKYNKG